MNHKVRMNQVNIKFILLYVDHVNLILTDSTRTVTQLDDKQGKTVTLIMVFLYTHTTQKLSSSRKSLLL